MPITLFCPGCRTRITLGDDRAGTAVACPKCATAISVPLPPSALDSGPDLHLPDAPEVPAPVPPKVRFKCPACHKVYKANGADVGKKMVCKGCGAVVIIPDAPVPKPLHGVPLPATGDVEPEEDRPEASDPAADAALPWAADDPTPPLPSPLPPALPKLPPPVVIDYTPAPAPIPGPDPGYRPRRRRKTRKARGRMAWALFLLLPLVGSTWVGVRWWRNHAIAGGTNPTLGLSLFGPDLPPDVLAWLHSTYPGYRVVAVEYLAIRGIRETITSPKRCPT